MAFCSSLSVKAGKFTGKFYKNNVLSKMEGKHEESKHVADLRDVFHIRDNAGEHKCKLVQDFLETETVVQLHNPSGTAPQSVLFTRLESL